MLLLTDGAIHDMRETKNILVELSAMPCSVVIIGVGNADFTSMEELDGDGGVLKSSSGKSAMRDVVQFVVFNDAMKRGDLGEQVLKEVPGQVCAFMEAINFQCQAVAQDMSAYAC